MALKSNQFVTDMFNYIVEDCQLDLKREWLDFMETGVDEHRPSENVFTPEIGRAIKTFADQRQRGVDFAENFLQNESSSSSQDELKAEFRKKVLKMAEKCISEREDYHAFFDFCGHVHNVFLGLYRSGQVQFLSTLMMAVAEVLRLMMWNLMSDHGDYNEYAELVNTHYKAYKKLMSHP